MKYMVVLHFIGKFFKYKLGEKFLLPCDSIYTLTRFFVGMTITLTWNKEKNL